MKWWMKKGVFGKEGVVFKIDFKKAYNNVNKAFWIMH